MAPPADAAILLSMEAVFAAAFGWLILDEALLPVQIAGCLIMLAGMLLAQIDVIRPKRALPLVILAITVLLVGCSPADVVQVEASPSVVPEMRLVETATLFSSPVPPPVPSNTPEVQQPTATVAPAASWSVCSPLQGITIEGLPGLVVNPYNPPMPGRDDPHQGVDLAVLSEEGGYAVAGTPVQAVLPGRVAGWVDDRFPYGKLLIIETPLKLLDLLPQLADRFPGEIVPVTPHPSLTCPEIDDMPDWNNAGQSLYLLYGHLGSLASVHPGDDVSCGQLLGEIGSSGNALNPHLHLEARRGPSGMNFNSMAHYDSSASQEEMATYCLWRVSGWFQHFDPLLLFGESGS
jgi:murein DD-endopeptidase MepM/ murein hydrolase activator NlpD